jgi:hypothetical protein
MTVHAADVSSSLKVRQPLYAPHGGGNGRTVVPYSLPQQPHLQLS